MTARHLGYNKKKVSIVLFMVTALSISGIVVYTGMFGAESAETALVTDQFELRRTKVAMYPLPNYCDNLRKGNCRM